MKMKQIIINDLETNYYITEEGKLFNKKTNNWLKGSISGGYKVFSIRTQNKKYDRLAHRLVAEYFLPNPNNLPIVNHIDGNKLNNNINNLEWTTIQENNIHAYKTGLKEKTNGLGQRIQYKEDLNNEIWKQYHNTTFMVSNKGRAKNCKTNNIMKGKVTKDGYVEWCFSIEGKKKSFRAHRLVFELFGNEDLQGNKVINHIDGNKTNNQIENLEQISSQGNILKSYYETKTNPNTKKVYKYSLNNELLDVYSSCAEAARQNEGCKANLICNVCNGKTNTYHGYIWRYE